MRQLVETTSNHKENSDMFKESLKRSNRVILNQYNFGR